MNSPNLTRWAKVGGVSVGATVNVWHNCVCSPRESFFAPSVILAQQRGSWRDWRPVVPNHAVVPLFSTPDEKTSRCLHGCNHEMIVRLVTSTGMV